MEKYTPTDVSNREMQDDVFSPNTHSRVDLLLLNDSSTLEKRIFDEENLAYFLHQDFKTKIAYVDPSNHPHSTLMFVQCHLPNQVMDAAADFQGHVPALHLAHWVHG